MFDPDRAQVREFFFAAWRKHREGLPLVGAEAVAVDVARLHPEYHPVLEDPAANRDREWPPEGGRTNPFLHLSLHLAIEEQLATDRPRGLRAAFTQLAARGGDRHVALHALLECLAETLWRAQRDAAPPDEAAYLDCVRRRAG